MRPAPLRRFGLISREDEWRIHPTVGAAVDAYLADYQVDWSR